MILVRFQQTFLEERKDYSANLVFNFRETIYQANGAGGNFHQSDCDQQFVLQTGGLQSPYSIVIQRRRQKNLKNLSLLSLYAVSHTSFTNLRPHWELVRIFKSALVRAVNQEVNKFVKLNWLAERELITCYSVHSCHFTKS